MLLVVGGLLMIAGAGCFALMWRQNVACWVYLLGACLFGGMQLMQTYEGRDHTVQRLKRIMSVADMCFVLSGLLMVGNVHRFLMPLFSSYVGYMQLIYNKWVLLLLVAAMLELYTMLRISSELNGK